MSLGAEDLVLADMTVPGATFTERITAAARAGFRGVGLHPRDRERALASGMDDATMRAVLAHHGIEVWEIDVLADWARGGAAGAGARAQEERLYALADALGGRCIVAVGDIDGGPDAAAERLAGVAARAAEHGLGVAVEFLPWTDIPDARTAWDIVRRSGAPNAGLNVDAWHHFRAGADHAGLGEVPGDRVLVVQLDDAGAPRDNLVEDTLRHRLPPGDGTFDLVTFIGLLRGMGVDAPWSVEVISDTMAALPPDQAARRCADAARRVLGLVAA